MEQKQKNIATIIVVSLLSLFVGVIGMFLVIRYIPIEGLGNVTINKQEKDVTITDEGIADAVEKVYNSVVTVQTYNNKSAVSSGTGFVYKVEDGKAYILTNHHVIENGNEIHLTFTDARQVTAKIVGSDKYADIAVLEVAEDEIISVAELGQSTELRVGDTVFAVGAPLDLTYSWTVTRGIVSGKDRMVEVSSNGSSTSDWIMKVVQTDAAINSGNSGGPLSNSNGEVIGINSLKLVSSGVEGMGFAIPIEDALEMATKIENGETVVRPYLGITMIDRSDYAAMSHYGITVDDSITSGVVVISAEEGTPAAKAGLQKGDVILELSGNKVKSIAELRYYLYKHTSGDTITLKVHTNGNEKEVKVTLTAAN